MLSPEQPAQPNPSYPALCRQDTTSSWSTDYGGNSKTLILTPAIKKYLKEIQVKREEETFLRKNEKMKNIKKSKNEEMNKK